MKHQGGQSEADIFTEGHWNVKGVADPVLSAKIIEARAEACASLDALKPHVFYEAKIFQNPNPSANKRWVCALVYESDSPLSRLTHEVTPKAYGDSPEEACEAFDRLWETGNAG